MSDMPRTIGWGLVPAPRLERRPSIDELVGMQSPGPGDYLRQLSPKTIDPMVAGFDRHVPRQGAEL